MKKYLLVVLGVSCCSHLNSVLADRENDMWQQYRADKAINELDAEFDQVAPQPKVVERVIERVVEKPVIVEQPEPQPAVAPQPEPQPESDTAAQPGRVSVTMDGIVFDVYDCRLAQGTLQCGLDVISVGQDGDLKLYASYGSNSSRLFDAQGNEYSMASVAIGNKSHKRHMRKKFIADVRSKGRVEFQNVSSDTSSIAMLELVIHNFQHNQLRRVQFRNVALAQ